MKKEKFYPTINESQINEIYKDYFVIDEYVPSILKKDLQGIIKIISNRLRDERFTERDIEDYLKDLIEETI